MKVTVWYTTRTWRDVEMDIPEDLLGADNDQLTQYIFDNAPIVRAQPVDWTVRMGEA